MQHTGERYTQARAALAAQRDAGDRVVSDRTRSLLGQLADVGLAAVSREHLERLPEPERRAAALEGLQHESWRARRTCAQLLDRVDLTPESVTALTRALDDEHPQVRRKAVHTLTCENCKPNGCVVDVRPVFERAIGDPSSLVRSMVLHVVTLHFFDQQWAVDLVAGVAASDKSAKLRESAADAMSLYRQPCSAARSRLASSCSRPVWPARPAPVHRRPPAAAPGISRPLWSSCIRTVSSSAGHYGQRQEHVTITQRWTAT
jgi:HEAT repeat protein